MFCYWSLEHFNWDHYNSKHGWLGETKTVCLLLWLEKCSKELPESAYDGIPLLLQVVMPTVEADVAFGLGKFNLTCGEVRSRVSKALDAVGMSDYLQVIFVHQYLLVSWSIC